MNILLFTEFFKSHKGDFLIFNYVESLKNEGHQVKVICCESELKSEQVYILKLIFGLRYKSVILNKWYSYFYKAFLITFQKSFNRFLFQEDFGHLQEELNKDDFSPDLVLQFTGGAYEEYLFDLSKELSSAYNIPYFLHSFDPIPNTPEWGENPIIRKATIKLLDPYIKAAQRVSAVSPQMTAYFSKTYCLEAEKMYTLYMPISYQKADSLENKRISFLYLGNIYGMRDPNPMFRGFNELMESNDQIELVLAGTKLNKEDLINTYPNFKKGLTFIEWTDQPDELIKKSTVLVDLNADIPGDVFISSKLMRYLGFDKPVLVIGNKQSASFDFSQKFSATFFTSNNETEISKAVLGIIDKEDSLIDRKGEVDLYSSGNLFKDYFKNMVKPSV